MLGNLTGWHMIIILAIILLLFGAPKLPALAKSIAQSMRIFKNEIGDDKKGDGTSGSTTTTTTTSSTDGDLPPKH
ncbi:twin-arginine translocase TatA/TatE family subunit [Frigoribacterium salinisoli]